MLHSNNPLFLSYPCLLIPQLLLHQKLLSLSCFPFLFFNFFVTEVLIDLFFGGFEGILVWRALWEPSEFVRFVWQTIFLSLGRSERFLFSFTPHLIQSSNVNAVLEARDGTEPTNQLEYILPSNFFRTCPCSLPHYHSPSLGLGCPRVLQEFLQFCFQVCHFILQLNTDLSKIVLEVRSEYFSA